MDLDTESWDYGSNFDTVNAKFVAPIDGIYHFDAKIAYGAAIANKLYLIMLYVGGTVVIKNYLNTGADTTGIAQALLSVDLKLEEDDYVELYARHLAGVNTVDVSGVLPAETSLSGFLVGTY